MQLLEYTANIINHCILLSLWGSTHTACKQCDARLWRCNDPASHDETGIETDRHQLMLRTAFHKNMFGPLKLWTPLGHLQASNVSFTD